MADIVSAATRSRMMSGIRSRNTRPEMQIRRGLHKLGLRYRIHCPDVPGRPDICFHSRRALVFVNGCFWHGHDCHLFKVPETRSDFWSAKIERNRKRDQEVRRVLAESGWRHVTIWECAMRSPSAIEHGLLMARVAEWVRVGTENMDVRGAKVCR